MKKCRTDRITSTLAQKKKHRLFISHAEKDATIVKALVELLYRIGLNEDDIFCSSISEIGVPIRYDIYEYLRNLLDSEDVVPVFMLSKNYYNSAACLNEMGAVWIKQADYYTLLLPGFSFGQIRGAVNPSKKGIKLDGENLIGDLTGLKDSIVELFHLPGISELRWANYCNEFIEFIQSKNKIAKSNDHGFDIKASQAFAIGDTNNEACTLNFDELNGSAIFSFDFSRTHAEKCSLAVLTGAEDLREAYNSGKQLEFWLKASDAVKRIMIEAHLSSWNRETHIDASIVWKKYRIPLCELVPLENEWKMCKEICFVVNRDSVKAGIVEVRDIKIV